MKVLILVISMVVFVGCENSAKDSKKKTARENQSPRTPSSPSPSPSPSPVPPQVLKDCKSYCEGFNLFEKYQKPYMSHLSFTNFGYRGIGRCRGHALLNQNLSVLVKFDPRGGCDTSKASCIDELKSKIRQARSNTAVTIRGFKNLYELSSVPEIKRYLRSIVAGTSNRYRASLGYIENTNFDTIQEQVFHELERRVSLSELPYVGLQGKLTGSHAVIAYASEFKNNKHVICARDPNYLYNGREKCDNYFYVNNNSEVYYKRKNKLPDFMYELKVYTDDDARLKNYKQALQLRCEQESLAKKLCK